LRHSVVPLRNVRAATVGDALIEFFSYDGIPRIIRSDNHMSYRSEVMQCLRDKLRIQAKFSAPLHFQSHGMIECLNANIGKNSEDVYT